MVGLDRIEAIEDNQERCGLEFEELGGLINRLSRVRLPDPLPAYRPDGINRGSPHKRNNRRSTRRVCTFGMVAEWLKARSC